MTAVVHMGIGKGASTTLQRNVFPAHPDIAFFGKNLKPGQEVYPGESRYVITALVNLDRFKGIPADVKERVAQSMAEAENDGKLFLFSNEHLSESTCPLVQAQILNDTFASPKLLLIIRNQLDAIPSHYKYVGISLKFAPDRYRGRFVTFREYFKFSKETYFSDGGHKARDWASDYFRTMDFDDFLATNEKIFGVENIIVVPFEELTDNFSILVDKIEEKTEFRFHTRLVEVPQRENASMSGRGVALLSMVSRIPGNERLRIAIRRRFPAVHNRLSRSGRGFRVPDEIKDEIVELFAKGNGRVAERYGLRLAELGYPV